MNIKCLNQAPLDYKSIDLNPKITGRKIKKSGLQGNKMACRASMNIQDFNWTTN